MTEKDLQEKIGKLQLFEQNLQQFSLQKQQFQTQLVELESALKELETTKKAYKIVGNIMVSSDKTALEKELKDKKEMVEIRINSIEKQESQIREKANALKEDVLGNLKKNEKTLKQRR